MLEYARTQSNKTLQRTFVREFTKDAQMHFRFLETVTQDLLQRVLAGAEQPMTCVASLAIPRLKTCEIVHQIKIFRVFLPRIVIIKSYFAQQKILFSFICLKCAFT